MITNEQKTALVQFASQANILRLAADFFRAQGITAGFTQKQAARLAAAITEEWTSLVGDLGDIQPEEKAALAMALYPLMNGSAFRQTCEKTTLPGASAPILAKSEGGRSGLSLADFGMGE